jgi:hypothetical protein
LRPCEESLGSWITDLMVDMPKGESELRIRRVGILVVIDVDVVQRTWLECFDDVNNCVARNSPGPGNWI